VLAETRTEMHQQQTEASAEGWTSFLTRVSHCDDTDK